MAHYTILYVAPDLSDGSPVALSLRAAGCRMVTTDSPAQALALLFVNRRIDAVVLDERAGQPNSIGLAKLLRSLRADIPILLVAQGKIDPLPRGVDACVCTGEEGAALLPVLGTLLLQRWNGVSA